MTTMANIFQARAGARDGAFLFSLSTYATIELCDYRNDIPKDADDMEKFGRRIVAELGFALMLVASLVETAARLALGVLAELLLLCATPFTDTKDTFMIVGFLAGGGAAICLGNALTCATALLRNIFERNLPYDAILPPYANLGAYCLRKW